MIIIAGGVGAGWIDYYDYHDYILEYDPEEDPISTVGHMTQPRADHAISVVQAAKYTKWCYICDLEMFHRFTCIHVA